MDSRINVVVRCRPLLRSEIRGRRSVSIVEDGIQIADKKFQFETVLDESTAQGEVYEKCVKSLVDGCFDGYNATVLAYGQTGSGKTFTIMGAGIEEEEEGIIPRALKHIFHYLKNLPAATHVANVRVSMIELYNDECKDLLHPEIPSRDIMIREDKHGRIFFTGAREEVVTSVRSAMDFLETGNINRSTAETLMNESSSRSHAIFTVSLEMIEFQNKDGVEERAFLHAKLHLVDLAGSERAKRTGAVGTRFKESVGINQGLLALGKVIRALTSHPVSHVPYRESKLTRFLQDSLGGNSRTLLLACVSTSDLNTHETLSTLQYAHRARSVHNKVMANISKTTTVEELELAEELESSLVLSLRAEIQRMQQQLTTATPPPVPIPASSSYSNNKELRQKLSTCSQILQTIERSLRYLLESVEDSEKVHRIGQELLQAVQYGYGQVVDDNAALRSSLRESMQGLQRLVTEHNNASHTSTKDSSVNEMEERIQMLEDELEECREDLQRDETIFAEKMKEIKSLKKTNKDLEVKAQKLSSDLLSLRKHLLRCSTRFKRSSHITTTTSPEDLDLSLAVAVAEPDISQLMEDLEALAREKEDLREQFQAKLEQELQQAEERWQTRKKELEDQHHQQVEGQIHQIESEKDGLKKELHLLKSSYRDLQTQFRQLKDRIAGEAEQQQQHEAEQLATLQQEMKDLQKQLSLENSEKKKLRLDLEEYRRKEKELIEKMNSMEIQLQRQRKELQAATLRKEDEEMSVKARREAEQQQQQVAVDDDDGSLLGSHLTAWLQERIEDLVQVGIVQVEVKKLSKALHILKSERAELESEKKKLSSNNTTSQRVTGTGTGRGTVGGEKETMNSDPKQEEEEEEEEEYDIKTLEEQVKEIDGKISSLDNRLQKVKKKKRQEGGQSPAKQEELIAEIDDIQQSILAYQEHRTEYLERINQLQKRTKGQEPAGTDQGEEELELAEELEALETEIALTQSRLEQEQNRLHTLGERNSKASGAKKMNPTDFDQQVDKILEELEHFGQQRPTSSRKVKPSSPSRSPSFSLYRKASRWLLQSAITEKVASGSKESSLKSLQEQLDMKCVEYDDLVKTMQRMRSEQLRRLEQQKRESEEKISFLLQQLKVAEQRGSTPLSSRSSGGFLLPHPPNTPTHHHHGGVLTSRTSTSQSQSHTALVHMLESAQRQTLEHLLEEIAQHKGQLPAEEKAALTSRQVNLEVVRRYAAEKERREALEKRNLEMEKELRSLRGTHPT